MGEGSPARDQRRGAYRAPAPSAQALVDWPESFGNRFSIFVDTEEEFDWGRPLQRESSETRAIAALPRLHRRFAERGVPSVYLVDYPVAADPAAVETIAALIAEDGRSTVGTQLHPWVMPPFEEEVNGFNSFAGNLPEALERAKLTLLTETIAKAFGAPPLIYRAGRYGIGPRTAGLLAELGYRIDSSMRSAYDYSAEGGPDFTAIRNAAFRFGPGDALVELPLTTIFTGRLRKAGAGLFHALGRVPHARGVAARLGLLSRVALTPEDMPIADALEAIRIAAGEGERLLNFSYHSPSAEPGHTPYVRDAADLAAFDRWWDSALDLLDRLGFRPASQADLIAAACGKGAASANAPGAGGL
ncbi:polysaccharide deacetylase family protein [Sphingomonas canadensis]|uniref:Polysaccharide deacetylase family protein n=1 Tax=Sphingomonas canadensis TaxID=1219257 RepID=A0ABW3H663_9SPHN|nr:polysaccharide deacetylase family protein [Sphingomonas canadensis]MCW3836874.1 polysaccharide deacetylase family protein [Sphingomonas canadensis]